MMRLIGKVATLIALHSDLAAGNQSQRPQASLRDIIGSQGLTDEFCDGHTLVVFAHQDDDLLWMMPFWAHARKFVLAAYPAADVFQRLVRSFPPELNYAARWTPAWGTVDNDIYADIFTDVCKRSTIVNLRTIKTHLQPLFTSDVRRVITHNNWGEYGHAQHRAVNIVVRYLAVERSLDVWALGCRVTVPGDKKSDYVDVAGDTGLPTIEGHFDPRMFRLIRQRYLDALPIASTKELTEKFQRWSRTLWTWSGAEDAFPMGWRPFIKLVDRGSDLTVGNPAIERLERGLKSLNDCPALPILPSTKPLVVTAEPD